MLKLTTAIESYHTEISTHWNREVRTWLGGGQKGDLFKLRNIIGIRILFGGLPDFRKVKKLICLLG